jgi:hypothetical protein
MDKKLFADLVELSRGELTLQHESLSRYSHDSSTGETLWP